MGDGAFDAIPSSSASFSRRAGSASRLEPVINPSSIRRKLIGSGQLTRARIETIARDIQAQLWRARESLFPDGMSMDAFAVLDPLVALRSIGFQSELIESLGQHSWEGKLFDVAGVIDRSERTVQISRRFPLPVRRFTAAHELGHALLHDGEGLHRDRALDGGGDLGVRRDRTEREADTFATYFLMPEKMIRAAFERAFKAPELVLNEETAFALNVDPIAAKNVTSHHVLSSNSRVIWSSYACGSNSLE